MPPRKGDWEKGSVGEAYPTTGYESLEVFEISSGKKRAKRRGRSEEVDCERWSMKGGEDGRIFLWKKWKNPEAGKEKDAGRGKLLKGEKGRKEEISQHMKPWVAGKR